MFVFTVDVDLDTLLAAIQAISTSFATSRADSLDRGRACASLVSLCAVTPARLPSGDLMIAAHHDGGIESRSRHFCTDPSVAPTDVAIERCDGHSPITSRKEVMPSSIVRNVYRDNPSRNTHMRQCGTDKGLDKSRQNVLPFGAMARDISQEEFVAGLTARIKEAREAAGFTQAQMAKLLDLEVGTYHKYECRTPMPHRQMIRFCEHTGALVQELFYGKAHAAITVRSTRRRAS